MDREEASMQQDDDNSHCEAVQAKSGHRDREEDMKD